MERMPVFVKVEQYQSVLELIKLVRRKLEEAKETLAKINDLKNEEDHQIETWQNTLGEVEKKVEFIDQSLNKLEHY